MTDVIFKTLEELRCQLVAHTMAVGARHYATANGGFIETHDFDDEMGNKLSVADAMPASAARASFGREDKTGQDPDADRKLMRFLAEHQHTTPFEHQSATFLVEAPLYIAREWMRHRTQSFNEISMRYCSDPANTFFMPAVFRKQAQKNKQCSEGELGAQKQTEAKIAYRCACLVAVAEYETLLDHGVARELARGVLGTAMVTRFYATANLLNWHRWYVLRSASNAQPEIQHYARIVWKALTELWPESCAALTRQSSSD